MKQKFHTALSLLVSASMILQISPSFAANAADEQNLNITFNNLKTNQPSVDGLTVTGGKVAVAVTSQKNKALHLKKYTAETSVIAQGMEVEYDDDVVYSVDIMGAGLPVNLTFGTTAALNSSSRNDSNLFKIENNEILTFDGKKIGTVNGKGYTTVSVAVKKMLVCDYYINGKKVLSNWDLENPTIGMFVAIRQSGGSSCYIDNLRCYEGSRFYKQIKETSFSEERVDLVDQQDFKGDITYFDNRFCSDLGGLKYNNVDIVPKSNQIVTTRLQNSRSADRTDYIYMKRNDNIDDCYFQVNMNMPSIAHADDFKHRYLKVEGDFKADILQDINLLIRDNKTTGRGLDTNININPDGSLSAGGARAYDVIKQGKWFHFVWAMNLDTLKYDIYIDGKKVIADKNLNASMDQFNMLRVNLNYSSVTGDLYVDNFSVTGLVEPYVDGFENKTGVIPDDSTVEEFMNDKIGIHTYGNMIYKDGVKSSLATNGIYDEENEQYYVTADTLNSAFDLELKEQDGKIEGDDISIKSDGTVTFKDGKEFKFEFEPKSENGKLYVPIKQFATDVVGKYVWCFKTGVLLFADYEMNIDTSEWKYHSERDDTVCTIWNDVDYINGYLQYIRPDAESIKNDYIDSTKDINLTQHPRIHHTADDFAKMKDVYNSESASSEKEELASYVAEADTYTADNLVNYDFSDSEDAPICKELMKRFKAWGYAYNLTGERKYAELAFKQFEKIASFPDMDMGSMAQTCQALQSLALGYDWLYEGFTAEEKQFVNDLLRYYLELYGNAFYGRLTAVAKDSSEWGVVKHMSADNVIFNNTIILTAIASLDGEYEAAFDYISKAVRSIEYGMQMFAPDGALPKSAPEELMENLISLNSNMTNKFGRTYNLFSGAVQKTMNMKTLGGQDTDE